MNRRSSVWFALLVTAVTVPLLFILDRRPDSVTTAPTTTLAGDIPDVLGTTPPPLVQVTIPPNMSGPPVIVVPDIPEGVPLKATYTRSISSPRECSVGSGLVPFGQVITIRNVNNNRTVRCDNSIPTIPDEQGLVVLPLEAYQQIADVTDAPVPVELTW